MDGFGTFRPLSYARKRFFMERAKRLMARIRMSKKMTFRDFSVARPERPNRVQSAEIICFPDLYGARNDWLTLLTCRSQVLFRNIVTRVERPKKHFPALKSKTHEIMQAALKSHATCFVCL